MGFFFKDKPIDCYKKVNKLVSKMYYLKKTLILKAESFNDNDRATVSSQLDEVISCFNCIATMDLSKNYIMMKRDVMYGSSVIDYESKCLSINDFMEKVRNEVTIIKRIVKGAPVIMSEINPNSISKDFFYDEHKLGVSSTSFINDPQYKLPPMFIV